MGGGFGQLSLGLEQLGHREQERGAGSALGHPGQDFLEEEHQLFLGTGALREGEAEREVLWLRRRLSQRAGRGEERKLRLFERTGVEIREPPQELCAGGRVVGLLDARLEDLGELERVGPVRERGFEGAGRLRPHRRLVTRELFEAAERGQVAPPTCEDFAVESEGTRGVLEVLVLEPRERDALVERLFSRANLFRERDLARQLDRQLVPAAHHLQHAVERLERVRSFGRRR